MRGKALRHESASEIHEAEEEARSGARVGGRALGREGSRTRIDHVSYALEHALTRKSAESRGPRWCVFKSHAFGKCRVRILECAAAEARIIAVRVYLLHVISALIQLRQQTYMYSTL